jgi:hypothetical protein
MRMQAVAEANENAESAWRSATFLERASMPLAVSGRQGHKPSATWYRGAMDGRGRAAWGAILLAAGCGASGATDAGVDTSGDAPATAADGFVCAQDPRCGAQTPLRVAACLYMLPNPPPEPTNVGVYLVGDGGMMKIPRDTQDQDGWDYVDGTFTSIQLYGSFCDEDRSGMFGTAMFVAGCPALCIP